MNRTRFLVVIAAIGAFAFVFLAVWLNRSERDPLSLTAEDDIHEACVRLLDDAATNSPTARDSLEKLRRVMIQLRDTWPGFTTTHIHPTDYTSQHLLATVYYRVAGEAARNPKHKDALIKLLLDTAPLENQAQLTEGFRFAIDESFDEATAQRILAESVEQ